MILDDVLTSVDGPHLDRFMELLHEETKSFSQFFVTTHYRPWRDRYRWAKGPTANTQLIELGPWTLQHGLHVGEFKSEAFILQQYLQNATFDRQVVASKAGIILESLLDFLTIKYRCSVPRNIRNEYTLGDLMQGIDAKLAKELRTRKPRLEGIPKQDFFLKPLLDSTISENWIRNAVGCHFRLDSDIPDEKVKKFAEKVLAMSDELICSNCKMLPSRRPSGSYWQCTCEELELHPLVYPGSDPRSVDDEN